MYPIHQLVRMTDPEAGERIDCYGMDGTDRPPLIATARKDAETGEWVATYIRETREARARDEYTAIHRAIHGDDS